MMRKILLICVVLLMSSFCFAQRKISKKDWLAMFKECATYASMSEFTGNKLDTILMSKRDISFIVHQELLYNYYDKADSVGRNFARNIEPIQVDPGHDLEGMKPLYKESLLLFTSKYLDQIAKKFYKQYLQSLDPKK